MSASASPLFASFYVALGGALGAVARFQLGRVVTHWLGAGAVAAFPWATLAANIIGSMAMGLVFGWLARNGSGAGEAQRLFLGVGLLGGFTTFSAFSLEMLLLVERGQIGLAVTYAALSVLAGLAALYIGLLVMRAFA
ncbi:MAG: fluoride efflux transporter CrcB [Erythrobacter sp.]